jgi:hypothetical protein
MQLCHALIGDQNDVHFREVGQNGFPPGQFQTLQQNAPREILKRGQFNRNCSLPIAYGDGRLWHLAN